MPRSLRARLDRDQSGGTVTPLGIDDVGADKMGPIDVISYCMEALKASSVDGDLNGCRVLLGFSVSAEDVIDYLGQVQPGAFSDPAVLRSYLSAQPRYISLVSLSEYKCMGVPEM